MGLEDLRAAAVLLGQAGVATTERVFSWVGWRSLKLEDPEGNVVELVADDPSSSTQEQSEIRLSLASA